MKYELCYGGFAPLDKEQHSVESQERPSGLHVKNTSVTAVHSTFERNRREQGAWPGLWPLPGSGCEL